MELKAAPADEADFDFAWQLFSSFVLENLFSGKPGARARSDWSDDSEREKFAANWSAVENYIISVDGERIGWASLSRHEDKISIENWHLVKDWTGRKVTETILQHLLPEWRAQGLAVEAEILQDASMTKEADSVAGRLGFKAVENGSALGNEKSKLMRLE